MIRTDVLGHLTGIHEICPARHAAAEGPNALPEKSGGDRSDQGGIHAARQEPCEGLVGVQAALHRVCDGIADRKEMLLVRQFALVPDWLVITGCLGVGGADGVEEGIGEFLEPQPLESGRVDIEVAWGELGEFVLGLKGTLEFGGEVEFG